MQLSTRTYHKLNHLFLLFLLIQPILDLITSLSLRLAGYDLTIGLFVRMLFLAAAGLYLILARNHGYQKKNLIYFGLVALLFVLNLALSSVYKPIFLLAEEVKFLLKVLYFNIALCLYYVVFTAMKESFWRERAINYIAYAVFLLGGLMTLAGLTGTGFASYEGGKMGHVGWFYAGNEIGAIMAIGLPIALYMALNKSRWYWLLLLSVIYGLLALGTKVGYGAIMITLIIGAVMALVQGRIGRYRIPRIRLIFIGVLILLLVVITPFTPLAHNMNMHLSWLGINYEEEAASTQEVTDDQVQNIVYSGREKYWEDYRLYFSEAEPAQKLFGMGYAGNYKEEAKMIEMDFHDIFYSLGVIGTLLYFLPLLCMLFHLIHMLFKRFSFFLELENALAATGVLLGFGISYIAGHVLTAPGVSLFLAVLLAFLTAKVKKEGV